jgi:hypothetical protein
VTPRRVEVRRLADAAVEQDSGVLVYLWHWVRPSSLWRRDSDISARAGSGQTSSASASSSSIRL